MFMRDGTGHRWERPSKVAYPGESSVPYVWGQLPLHRRQYVQVRIQCAGH
jgi:hypothetical protein